MTMTLEPVAENMNGRHLSLYYWGASLQQIARNHIIQIQIKIQIQKHEWRTLESTLALLGSLAPVNCLVSYKYEYGPT